MKNDANVTDTNTPVANVNATQAVTTVENADLVVTKTHTGVTTPGGALTYTITVLNNGPSAATNVTLNDTAPANITFGTVTVVSANPTGIATCSPSPTTTTIACLFATIASGQTVTVTVAATISSSATVGSSIANTASTATATLDATSANNTSTDTFLVGAASADLGVTLTASPTTVAPGGTVTFTVGVQNLSATVDATNVVVTDTLPTGLTAVSPPTTPATGNGTAAVASNVWTWTIPTVAKSGSVTATFDATVDSTTALTTITNTATITKSDQTDPVATNNTVSADLTIQAANADLNLSLSTNNPHPQDGDTIKITLLVANNGPADATNVVVSDTFSNGLKFLGCSGCKSSTGVVGGLRSAGQKKATTQTFTAPLIQNGFSASAVLSFKVTATQGSVSNKASIQSMDQADPTVANNTDNLSLQISFSNNSGSGSGSGSGTTTGGTSGAGSTTAFTGFTAGQLIPWFMLFGSLGLVALEYSRRRPMVAPIGHTWGFEPGEWL